MVSSDKCPWPRWPTVSTWLVLRCSRTPKSFATRAGGARGLSKVESLFDAERFVERVGFAACMTDSRRPGPSLYVAVCGRRDAVMPRNVQKDPEASHTWLLKDEVVRHGKVYYGKLAGARAMFIAPRMVRYFHAIWGVRRVEEPKCLSRNAQAILRVLRREWEIATSDLRDDSGIKDRATFTRALDELQAAMLVVPAEVYYQPTFTYIWTLCCVRETGEGGGDRRDGRLRTGVLLANAAYCLLSLPRLRRRTCRRACNGRSSGTRTRYSGTRSATATRRCTCSTSRAESSRTRSPPAPAW